ncbi:phage major capsid protein [Nitrosomonas marina]|uniref:Phage major capsid protein, HK97 family n=1 Tax=Nitrosomonas marina TaxID=917 RepID=A0A1H8I4K7_9PROT|nr:phage major capsid protein [Nitrosomonas marina]SEN63740.1 phage major capsid protein, HK97 family [Nitrosomonas marina]
MTQVSEKDPVEVVKAAFSEFQEAHNKRYNELQSQTDRLEELLNRPGALDATLDSLYGNKRAKRCAVTSDGRKLPILAKDESFAAHHPVNRNEPEQWSIGDFVKQSMGVAQRQNSALETGAATVPTFLGSRIVDDIRARNTLIRAGAMTLPIDGKTVISRIDADPTVYVHTEAAADISTSLPTFTPITLEPKTLVAQVPLSVELVADSANLDSLLRTSLAAAFAAKLDTVGITALLADSDIEESASGQDPATWAGVVAAVGEHLGNDGDLPSSLISNAAEFNTRNSETVTAGEWLGRPQYLDGMADLFSTSMTAGKFLLGDFATGLILAVRQDMRLELIRWNGLSDATHALVAYMRGQFYVTQPRSLFRGLKTVV